MDHYQMVRTGLRMLIDEQPEMTVVGEVSNRTEALAQAASKNPNLILLEVDLGSENGLDFLPDLREAAAGARVLIITGVKDPETHRRAALLGAAGLVLKESPAEVLLKAIRKIHQGEIWLDRSVLSSVLNEMTQAKKKNGSGEVKVANLTPREREVVILISEGLRNKQIAKRLFICETTVTHHLSSIFSKLEVSDRLELVIYAFAHGLARTPQKIVTSNN